MTTVNITATARADFGKGAARRTRRAGFVPAVIYGPDTELLHISLPDHDLTLALRKPRVVLSVDLDGTKFLTKPRDVQREPVKRYLEHIDLIVISKIEASLRSDYADAVKAAEAAALEAGVDTASVIQAMEEAIALGEDPMTAAEHAVSDVTSRTLAQASANAAEDAVDAAVAAEAAVASVSDATPAP